MERDHPRLRITENAPHRRFRAKTGEAIRIPQPPSSLTSPCHPNRMANSSTRRNAESLCYTQLSAPLSARSRPHDSAKTQRKAKSLRQKPGKGCLAGPVCGSPRGKGKEGRNSFRCICTNQKLARDCLFCGRLQRHPRARMPQNDHCAVQIQADVCFRWRLLRWRRLSALGNAASWGALATVAATFTAFR